MATELKRKLDYDDYLRLPDDGKRYEILDGELYGTPAPSPLHQRVCKRLQRIQRVCAEPRLLRQGAQAIEQRFLSV